MKPWIAFVQKEALELIRSYKLFILCMVFLALGFMSPLTAKYMPELLMSFMPEGMSIEIAEPSIMDSWLQFFKNVPQIGLILVVILCSSSISSDFHKGTLINMITKGLSRTTIILSKFLVTCILWTLCYGIAILVTCVYNTLFWSDGVSHLWEALAFVWLFGVVLIALLVLGCVLTKNSTGGFLLCGVFLLLCMIVSLFPQLQMYNPLTLIATNAAYMKEEIAFHEYIGTILCSIIIILIALGSSIIIFRKKPL